MKTSFHRKTRKERFGEILRREGLITQEQLDRALEVQRSSGGFLGEILVEQGAITETDIVKTISVQLQIPVIRPAQYEVDRELLQQFTHEFIYTHRVLPFDRVHDLVLVATPDMPSDETIASIRESCGANVALFATSVTDIESALSQLMPLSDDERERFRFARRGSASQTPEGEEEAEESLMAPEVPEMPEISEVPEVPEVSEVSENPSAEEEDLAGESDEESEEEDASWESIFEQAEKNLRQGP
ncbi:MAG: hypothetical protein JXP34_18585 [Planctomycetes bacterium]|nr:hypothetical protein [Planctomycetota bacterium]